MNMRKSEGYTPLYTYISKVTNVALHIYTYSEHQTITALAEPMKGTVPVVAGVGPVVAGVGPVVAGVGPVVAGVGPVVAGVGPVVAGVGPVVAGVGPVVAGVGPVVAGVGPVVAGVGPVVAGVIENFMITNKQTLSIRLHAHQDFHESFQDPHWKSVGLLAISRLTF